jgi:hypothetical protein
VKKNFIVLGTITGVISGISMMVYMKIPNSYFFSLELMDAIGFLIPSLAIVIPQYIYYRVAAKVNFLYLFLTGCIALIVLELTIEVIGPYFFHNLTTDFTILAYIIGAGLVFSLVTAFLMRLIKKRKKESPEALDDLDY